MRGRIRNLIVASVLISCSQCHAPGPEAPLPASIDFAFQSWETADSAFTAWHKHGSDEVIRLSSTGKVQDADELQAKLNTYLARWDAISMVIDGLLQNWKAGDKVDVSRVLYNINQAKAILTDLGVLQ